MDDWNSPVQNMNQTFSQFRRPVSASGFYSDEYRVRRNDATDQIYPRPSSQLNSSRQMNASYDSCQSDVHPKTKLMLYLGAKRMSSAAVSPTSLQIDRTDNADILSLNSFNALSPTRSDLSVASRASTERMDGGLISSRRARMAAEADLQVKIPARISALF